MSSSNASHTSHSPLHTKITGIVQEYFSSARHAQILATVLVSSLVLAGTTRAQTLVIPTNLNNAVIAIQKIFLSTDGIGGAGSASTRISLDGTNGNITTSGDVAAYNTTLTNNATVGGSLRLTRFTCPTGSSGCVLLTDANGNIISGDVTQLVSGALSVINNGAAGGGDTAAKYFGKQGSADVVDTGAKDIYFAAANKTGFRDTDAGFDANTVKLRIGINEDTAGTYGNQLIVRKGIETRTQLEIKTPINNTTVEKSASILSAQTGVILSRVFNETGTSTMVFRTYEQQSPTNNSFFRFEGNLSNPTKVGINTPAGTKPTEALDVNGETRSRASLTVGGYIGVARQAIGIPVNRGPSSPALTYCYSAAIPAALRCGSSSATSFQCTSATIAYDSTGNSYSCFDYQYVGGNVWTQQYSMTPVTADTTVVADTVADTVAINAATTVSGNTVINGKSTLNGDTTIRGATNISGATTITGATLVNGKLNITNTLTNAVSIATPYNTSTGNTISISNSTLSALPDAASMGVESYGGAPNLQGKLDLSYTTSAGASVLTTRIRGGGISYFNGGNVGIGTATPAEKLHVSGNIRADAFYYNSDRRYKSDITLLDKALDKILSLNGYSYVLKTTGKASIGVIAQEVEKVFPSLVKTDAEGYKSVEYGNLVAPLIEAVKELAHKIDALTNKIDQLFAKYADQQAQINTLEARLARLEAKTK